MKKIKKVFALAYIAFLAAFADSPLFADSFEDSIQDLPVKETSSFSLEDALRKVGGDWLGSIMQKAFIDVDYSYMPDKWTVIMLSADLPVYDLAEKNAGMDKMGFALEIPILYDSIAGIAGLEYLQNREGDNNIHACLIELDFTRRILNNFAWFVGGGLGLRFDFSCDNWVQEDWTTGYLALKANTGFLINVSNVFTKIDLSYNNVSGFSLGAGIGIGIKGN